MYALIGAVLMVMLKGTLHIVDIFVVLCVIYYFLLRILCQDYRAGVVEGLGCGLEEGILVRFSIEETLVFQAF